MRFTGLEIFSSTIALMVMTGVVHAHPGHGDLLSGVLHPLSGLDHFMAMFAVGVWMMLFPKKHRWILPAAFITSMTAGLMLHVGPALSSMAEQGILLSLFLLGMALLSPASMSRFPAAVIVGFAGICHGVVHHSVEVGSVAVGMDFMAGVLVSTIALHALGACSMKILSRRIPHASYFAGLLALLAGATSFIG